MTTPQEKARAAEKRAVYGSVVVIIGALVSGGLSGIIWLSVLAAFGVLAVFFVPKMSPNTALPASKGSLLVVLGGIAGLGAVLGLLTIIADIGSYVGDAATAGPLSLINDIGPGSESGIGDMAVLAIFFLISVAGAKVMAQAGWQAFQAEGGKFNIGTASGSAGATTPPAPPAPPAATPPPDPTAQPMQEPKHDPMADQSGSAEALRATTATYAAARNAAHATLDAALDAVLDAYVAARDAAALASGGIEE